jgi:hypothetical protein
MTLHIPPNETVITGAWIATADGVIADATAKRIDALLSSYLIELARSEDGWGRLLRDPGDGRLWELTYPSSHMHGGGPPALSVISAHVAHGKYGRS